MNVESNLTTPTLSINAGEIETRPFADHTTPPTKSSAAFDASAAFEAVRSLNNNANVISYQHANTESAPKRSSTCYYPLKPSEEAAQGTNGYNKGHTLRGTPGYERLVNTIMHPLNPEPNKNPVTKTEAEAAVDQMDIKQGTILLARCHDGHTDSDSVVHSK